ncbi:sporulation protein [Paenibacillus sp. N3/727]|uniref:sporulation protein n=1 Tax=Paenibacillus sp. N3/727 TaxID=2925845 RepID=UPI001F531A7C|nr:sporulation protein [Paenibacillus sp. N3/727]UNK17879.1 sporulation protein [Paenibacillus sp. N3/727]
MSFFNKMLASVGIGAVEVNTHLEKSSYYPGEDIRGVIHIRGGNVDQNVDRIYVKLMTEYTKEINDKKFYESYTIAKVKLSDSLIVKQGDKLEIPFEFPLPLETPLTLSRQPVWVHTGLDIEYAIDPKDRDFIEVTPHPYTSVVLDAVSELGFRFKMATCEHHPRLGRGVPFVQEIEFYPGPEYARRITELELIMHLEYDRLSVLVEIDRRGRGLSGWLERSFDMDESQCRMILEKSELKKGPAYVAEILKDLLDRQI